MVDACRCYARNSIRANNCRKKKCGHCNKVKMLRLLPHVVWLCLYVNSIIVHVLGFDCLIYPWMQCHHFMFSVALNVIFIGPTNYWLTATSCVSLMLVSLMTAQIKSQLRLNFECRLLLCIHLLLLLWITNGRTSSATNMFFRNFSYWQTLRLQKLKVDVFLTVRYRIIYFKEYSFSVEIKEKAFLLLPNHCSAIYDCSKLLFRMLILLLY